MVISAPSIAPGSARSPGAGGPAWTSRAGRPAAVTGGILPRTAGALGDRARRVASGPAWIPSLEQLLAEFDPGLPLARARSLPSPWYRDLASRRWSASGCSGAAGSWWPARSARTPGDFVTADVAGEPLLVLRDDAASSGPSSTSAAPRGLRDDRAAGQRQEAALPLPRMDLRPPRPAAGAAGVRRGGGLSPRGAGPGPVRVDRWGPLVFVHLGDAAPPLRDWLAPLPAEMGTLDGSTLPRAPRVHPRPATGRCSSTTTWTADTT
jgi:hypothetical protein